MKQYYRSCEATDRGAGSDKQAVVRVCICKGSCQIMQDLRVLRMPRDQASTLLTLEPAFAIVHKLEFAALLIQHGH